MADMKMPTLGADMTQGKLVEWLVKPGDPVTRGDVVAVVDTDKAEFEIESFHDGIVQEIVVHEGEKVPVGTIIARIGAGTLEREPPQSEGHDTPPPQAMPDAGGGPPPRRTQTPPSPPSAPSGGRRRVTPLARRVAAGLGVDLDSVRGTGPSGAVIRADVEAAAAGRGPAPGRSDPAGSDRRSERQATMRDAIASLMARSKREVPHYYLERAIDLTPALGHLDVLNAERPAARRLLPAAMLLRATALAAHDAPALNGHWVDGVLRSSDRVHLGVAIALRGGGVVAPAIHDADRLGLDDLMAALRDLTARVRGGRLRGGELTDATITVTQLGDRGADLVHGVVFLPQVALVGFGRVAERPWALDGMVGARRTVTATLAADHRASDGHAGSLLLEVLAERLAVPEGLL